MQNLKLKNCKKDEETTVILISNLPKKFEENELKLFFKQFGKILTIHLSRSKKVYKIYNFY